MTSDEFLLQALVTYLAAAIASFCVGLAVYALLRYQQTRRTLRA